MNRLTDRELVVLAQNGEQKAFTLLTERYRRGLLGHIAELLSGNWSVTEMAEGPEDICQETFKKAFLHIDDYNPKYEFSTWLYNIGRNTAIDYSRKRKIAIEAGLSAEKAVGIINYGNLKNSPEDNMISSQEYSNLLKAIEELNERYREIAKMRFIQEYAYEEIAQKLDIPLNTVRTRLKRAKDILVKKLDE
ncbi:MAG: sigma-70 family RNA polymerase sigma factor [Bacteroidales bacterium]|nr:sigma-70 family RNA polymerase sigma factor [Bacteroidales bacterium]MBP3342739.1 sigma-70 family RNA polymerase sigma factor [Bacteroidales bacterium]MBQ3521235.1 sigma-70 family RNA polymerase sigma factor [Bacteroidales bacterium]MBQ5802813.1 sigma-70 family RNA polymerase sigma factor [Bacteroidales bacterium]MBQ7998782.1 sigma-70 family RNA polymerase sigma factor [Bacteroidales bacterium]